MNSVLQLSKYLSVLVLDM